MFLAYNTNGLAHHDLLEAIALLADIGYQGVSITLDHGALNPFDERTSRQLDQVAKALQECKLRCVIETGGRYLLNPRIKHEPTLVTTSSEWVRRVYFQRRAIELAANLGAECVSMWSGVVRDGVGSDVAFSRLVEGMTEVLDRANQLGVDLAFEPEPGMLIDTLEAYDRLLAAMPIDTRRLRLTIDVGHLHCQGEVPISAKIRQYAEKLANVHIEDMLPGVHEHLMFGEGNIDFPPVLAALAEIRYDGCLSVELSRHSHVGPAAAQRAYDFLRPLIQATESAYIKTN